MTAAESLYEPMSAVDRAWLEMDAPHNPMVVASIMDFVGVADPRALARAFVERLVRERRFRQRVVRTKTGEAWVEDDELHLGYHVLIRYPNHGGSLDRLQAAVAEEMGADLDRALPLWRICLFVRPGGRVTLLFRAHHAIADGVALMRGLLELADGRGAHRDDPPPVPVPRAHGPLGGVIHGLEAVNHLLEDLTHVVMDDLRHPDKLAQQLTDARRMFLAVSRVFLLPENNPRRLRQAPGGKRAVAWADGLSFAAVRRFAHAQGVTINDVFLAALAGAFGRYLREVDGRIDEDQNLRVSVPVNLRAPGDGRTGNSFGLVLVDLPIGLEGAHARLDVVAERMAALKKSPEARATYASLAAAGHLPVAAEKRLINFVGGKAAAVVSNLPAAPRAEAGRRHARQHGVLAAADRRHRHRRELPELRRPRHGRRVLRHRADRAPAAADRCVLCRAEGHARPFPPRAPDRLPPAATPFHDREVRKRSEPCPSVNPTSAPPFLMG